MRLDQASWMEVRDKLKNPQGIIMATGSTEQHGPIGLIGTDTICSETIASGVASKANMYLAPSIGFTPAEFNMKFTGTISISAQTFKSLLREVTSSLLKHGFKYVLIVNGHGANIDPIKDVMIDFNNKLFFKSWWDFPTVNDIRNKEFGDWEGMHATPSEISITQINQRVIENTEFKKIAENPPQKLTKDFIIAHSGDKHGTAEEHHRAFPDGRVGSHSAMANPEIGKKIVNASVEGFLEEIERLNSTLL